MNKMQLLLFILKMFWEYGPKLWKLGKSIYDEIESRSVTVQEVGSPEPKQVKILSSEKKAKEFNRKAEMAVARSQGYMPKRSAMNEFRENVWKYRNPNATPKDLADARLRIGVSRAAR